MVLNQVTITCKDYGRAVTFYRRLGLVQIVDAPPRYARFESPGGAGATLSIHSVERTAVPSATIYFDYESPEALDRRVGELVKDGFVFHALPTDRAWGWREARVEDPDGNEICLMHAGHMRRFPDWRMDGRTS